VLVRARVFVLAAGAIENARLLLNSRQDLPAGLGNEHDQVGRYFMNHPKGYVGRIVLSGDFPTRGHYFSKKIELFSGYVGLRLSEATQHSREVLNSYVRLERGFPWTGRSELAEAKVFLRCVRNLLAAPRMQDLATVIRLIPRIVVALPLFLKWGIVRIIRGDRPSVLLPRYFLEMEPRPENRITLGDQKDALGIPLPLVHYTLSPKDTETFKLLRDTLRGECARRNIGAYAYGDEVPTEDASHHLGGTRMGHDPASSVVDTNLKIHTVSNVYVAGGGVFPTSGCANPTMVIAALSARLAQHLRDGVLQTTPKPLRAAGVFSVLLVGAGARAREDILPAVESLPDFKVSGVFARRPGTLFGKRENYTIKQLAALEPGDVAQADIIYLSIPPQEVTAVLNKLSQYDCSHLTLILPTPVKIAIKAGQFKYIFVEEDSVFLPWLASIKKPLGAVVLNRSAYRYHAIALIKKLCGGEIDFGFKLGRSVWLWCKGARVRLIEPRDYALGTMELLSADGSLQSAPSFTELPLSAEEVELFGRAQEHDTVINRMHDYKRVGLRRLFQSAARGEGWQLADGLDDTRVDTLLHRNGLYSRYF
jgi:hypothetical protein